MSQTINDLRVEFMSLFEIEWRECLQSLGYIQRQLLLGSRLRPQIVFWGYLSGVDIHTKITLSNAVYMAVSIELIHKASLLLDDWIDGDVARHGESAFHVEFGEHSTVMIAMLMVSESFDRLLKLDASYKEKNDSLGLLIKTTKSMTSGILKELELSDETQYEQDMIRKIALLETATIISNSFLLGHSISNRQNNDMKLLLAKIGEMSGYLFQLLNDLEAISDPTSNEKHKGVSNLDFNRYRKNLVVTKLYDFLTRKEKVLLTEITDANAIMALSKKYKINEAIMREADLVFNEILQLVSISTKYGASYEWSVGFEEFLYMLREVARKRV